MNGQKLKVIREFRNYSQEYIANKLGIRQNAYSRIETNQTKISAERLQQLASILSVPPEELLSDKEPVIHFSFTHTDICSLAGETQWKELIENTRQLYRQIICTKDEKIIFLENEIDALRKERKRILQVMERLTMSKRGGLLT